jgi:hypothetical protein
MEQEQIKEAFNACDRIDMVVSFMRGTAVAMMHDLIDGEPFFDGTDLLTAANLIHESSCILHNLVCAASFDCRSEDQTDANPERPEAAPAE